jgi:hypothetical protein
MAHLKLDRRGYPIPAGALIDKAGRPHFTVMDEAKRQKIIIGGFCAICGRKLHKVKWLVGGPASAFHKHGAYLDPPMHLDCLTYALQVCPYLAAPRYTGLIEDATINPAHMPPGMAIMHDEGMMDKRPPVFVAVAFTKQHNVKDKIQRRITYIRPDRPLVDRQFWQNGNQLPSFAGDDIVTSVLMQQFNADEYDI